MQNVLLTINTGSSSLKFSLFSIKYGLLERIFYGIFEFSHKLIKYLIKNNNDQKIIEECLHFDYNNINYLKATFDVLLKWLEKQDPKYIICAAGHRVVHGGESFLKPSVINQEICLQLEKYNSLAPLHQPYNIEGIKILLEYYPHLFQVACFDTTFHVTQPDIAQAYALPEDISPIPIRRYGFHGISYEYIAQVIPSYLNNNSQRYKAIVAHLGHGASLCAILNGKSIATTMGFTALDGLPMATRCGNIDPGIILYLLQIGMTIEQVSDLLYKNSGFLGVSKISSDVRILLASSEISAKKAIDLFIYRIQREIGSLVAALDGLDALIFTGGIGEHSSEIRAYVCKQLNWLAIKLNDQANHNNALKISENDSKVSVWVIPTNEELIIAQHTFKLWNC